MAADAPCFVVLHLGAAKALVEVFLKGFWKVRWSPPLPFLFWESRSPELPGLMSA